MGSRLQTCCVARAVPTINFVGATSFSVWVGECGRIFPGRMLRPLRNERSADNKFLLRQSLRYRQHLKLIDSNGTIRQVDRLIIVRLTIYCMRTAHWGNKKSSRAVLVEVTCLMNEVDPGSTF